MSLQRLAHRLATVAALRGRTLAGAAVRDSAIPPIDVMAGEERRPFIAVYTDDSSRSLRGLVPNTSGGTLAIVIEIGVTAQMENDAEWVIPTTDAGMEIRLDAIERQIEIILQLNLSGEGYRSAPVDESNVWAAMWRRLHHGDPEVKSIRGASAEKGVRFAGRQYTIEVKPYAEPPFGPAATGLWADFLALLAADPEFGPLEPMIRALIEADAPPFDWETTMRALYLTQAEADALLVSLPDGADETDVVVGAVDAQPAEPTA